MKKSILWTSIVESVIVTLIVSLGVMWAYSIYVSSSKLALTTEKRIEAIQIAREWIEAFTNIRNTNWLLFPPDIKNCWNTLNYDNNCVWDSSTNTDIATWSYIIYQKPNNRWHLLSWATFIPHDYSNIAYRNVYKVSLNSWTLLYTQSWWIDFLPTFTREIIVDYLSSTWWVISSNHEKIKITSLVSWIDASSNTPHKIRLSTILTNWENKD